MRLARVESIGLLAVAVVGALLAAVLQAATFPDLYTVTVEAEPGGDNSRQAIVQRGMGQLLVRVTGRRDASTHPDLEPLISGADRYMIQVGSPQPGRFVVGFTEASVTRELSAVNWPVWGAERPLTLLWIAVETAEGERALLSSVPSDQWSPEMAEIMDAAREEIEAAAERRGLPVMLPTIVLEDSEIDAEADGTEAGTLPVVEPPQNTSPPIPEGFGSDGLAGLDPLDTFDPASISVNDVFARFEDRIARASEPYGVDAYAVAEIMTSEFGLSAQWTLAFGAQRNSAFTASIGEGIDWVADQFAAEFSIAGGVGQTRVLIRNVGDWTEYGRVMSYLESLSALQGVDVESFDGTDLTLTLRSRGDESVLARLLGLGGVLTPAVTPSFGEFQPSSLVYEVARAAPEP